MALALTQTSAGAFTHSAFKTAVMVYPGQIDMHPLPGFEDFDGYVLSDLEQFLWMFRVGAVAPWAIAWFMPLFVKFWGQVRAKYPKAKLLQYGMPICEDSILAATQEQFDKMSLEWGQLVLLPVLNCGLVGVAPSCYYNGKPTDGPRAAAQCKVAISARKQLAEAGLLVNTEIHPVVWPRLNGTLAAPMLTTDNFLDNEVVPVKDLDINGMCVWGVDELTIRDAVAGTATPETITRLKAEIYQPLSVKPVWPAEQRFLTTNMSRQWLEKLDALAATLA